MAGSRKPGRPIAPYLLAGLVLAAVAVGGLLNRTGPVDRSTDCPVGRPPPATVVIDLDTTDALVATQPRQTMQAVEQALAGLPAGSRVAILQISGDSQVEAAPLFDRCLPGAENNVDRNRMRDAVLGPIRARLEALRTAPEAPSSPILESVLDIAQDQQLHSEGGRLTIVLISDALQNSPFASAYRSGRAFPEPKGKPLAGVKVRVVLLRNRRDQALQDAAAGHLTAWLGRAGAETDYAPPTWLALTQGPQ
jgi:hypothetical protein